MQKETMELAKELHSFVRYFDWKNWNSWVGNRDGYLVRLRKFKGFCLQYGDPSGDMDRRGIFRDTLIHEGMTFEECMERVRLMMEGIADDLLAIGNNKGLEEGRDMNYCTEQIANFLKIPNTSILRCEEWTNVFFIVIEGKGGRFLSKKIVKEIQVLQVLDPAKWTLHSFTRKQQEQELWVARIYGLDPTYTFKRQFLEPLEIEWGKFGMKMAKWEIDSPGYYQDSIGNYLEVWQPKNKNCLVADSCSYTEVKHEFTQRQKRLAKEEGRYVTFRQIEHNKKVCSACTD